MDQSDNEALTLLANPFYAVTFHPHVLRTHSKLGSKEDWVAANAHTMNGIGVKSWLSEFLDFITMSRDEYDGHDILNPALVVNVSQRLKGEHEPLVTRELWLQANEKTIGTIGSEAWLWQLLDVLESGGPAALK